jgi:hypothetical protein
MLADLLKGATHAEETDVDHAEEPGMWNNGCLAQWPQLKPEWVARCQRVADLAESAGLMEYAKQWRAFANRYEAISGDPDLMARAMRQRTPQAVLERTQW